MLINKVELCGVNTAKLPVLSAEEKKKLFEKILQGDNQAREQFIQGNLRLVLSVIQRFNSRGEPADDLFQVGCIGLIKAIDNFDVTQEVQFSTYAVPMIIGEVRRYLRDNNAIRVSRSLRDLAYKAMQMREELFNKNNKEPTVSELAKELAPEDGDITNEILETVEFSASANPNGEYEDEDAVAVEAIRPADEILDYEIEQ